MAGLMLILIQYCSFVSTLYIGYFVCCLIDYLKICLWLLGLDLISPSTTLSPRVSSHPPAALRCVYAYVDRVVPSTRPSI